MLERYNVLDVPNKGVFGRHSLPLFNKNLKYKIGKTHTMIKAENKLNPLLRSPWPKHLIWHLLILIRFSEYKKISPRVLGSCDELK